MHKETKLTSDINTNKKISVTCRSCKNETKHIILKDVHIDGQYGEEYYGEWQTLVDWQEDYQIVQCFGCENITFRNISSNSEDIRQISPDDYEYVITESLFPNPENGRKALEDSHILPTNLKRIYDETLNTLNSGQAVLSGIGIRAIVETVCKDKNTTSGNLFGKINELVTLGVLTQDGADILHKLRTLGNDAAHEVKPHTNSQLGLVFDVIDHLIQGVYILPHHAKSKFN